MFLCYSEKPNTNIESSGKVSYHTEADAIHKPFGHSHFVCTVKPYCLAYGFVYLPKHFASANGLIAKKCGLIIKDETQRLWNLRISSCKTQTYIGDGWRKFIADNGVKKGDHIMFEVVTDGETPIWKFHFVTDAEMRKFHEKLNTSIKSSKKASSHGKTAAHKPFVHSSFVCTIKPYCLTYGALGIPRKFAYANGLIANKKYDLIVKDGTQRSWNLRIRCCKVQFYIMGDGFRKFIADNCLKKGDHIMFEVVTDGETPIWKFHVVTHAETPMRKFHGKPNTSIKSSIKASSHGKTAAHKPFVHSSFVCTIKPTCLTKGSLHVPKDFAYANGLIANKKYDLIVKDETQRSWNLRISYSKTKVCIIGDGFRKFIADNCLKKGDYIMFEVVTDGEAPIWKFHVIAHAETPMRKFHEKPTTSIKSSIKASSHGKAAAHKPLIHSSFVCTIKPYCLRGGILRVPSDFACANGLIANKKYYLIIKDETQRLWNLRINSLRRQVYIGEGCRKFIADNCLKEGDRIVFEVVSDGETPIWEFHVVTYAETPMRKCHGEPNTRIERFVHSSFVCTIKPYILTGGILYLPKDFAYANGLLASKNCGLIIKDEAQRLWKLRINSRKTYAFIGEGCRKFIADNCLKEGDHVMFEVVTDGETPIWKFHVVTDAETSTRKFQGIIKTSDVTALKIQVAASTSANDNPHFISTIKPYVLKRSAVYLPMAFAKATGLMDRHCEIILIDEKRRSWSMWLGFMGHHFGIKKGWRQFIKANGFRVGDTYKFELINNGEIPRAYISAP